MRQLLLILTMIVECSVLSSGSVSAQIRATIEKVEFRVTR